MFSSTMNLPPMSCAQLRQCYGYKVNKKNWTRRDFQDALFCEAYERYPELYDPQCPEYKNVNAKHPSWRKLALERKKIFGDEEPNLMTVDELLQVFSDMADKVRDILNAAAKIDQFSGRETMLKMEELMEYGDQRCPYLSHMMYVLRVDYHQRFMSLSFAGPKMFYRNGVDVIIHSDGSEEPVHSLSVESRCKLHYEIRQQCEIIRQRGKVQNRLEAHKAKAELDSLKEVCVAARLMLQISYT